MMPHHPANFQKTKSLEQMLRIKNSMFGQFGVKNGPFDLTGDFCEHLSRRFLLFFLYLYNLIRILTE